MRTRPSSRSVLLVVPSPDGRAGTASLRVVAEELGRRAGVDVEVWFLRSFHGEEPWPGSRVIDDLRTWAPAATLESIGAGRVASALRGARLRWWNRQAAADTVVLDDGVGERVLTGARPFVVVRHDDHPVSPDGEAPTAGRVDLEVGPGSAAAGILGAPLLVECPPLARLGEGDERARTRRVLGLDPDVPLVVGWGSDGWIDGPDVFVRVLWAVADRHGIECHGLWLGLGADPHEVERLRAEAARCGLAGRVHFRSADAASARACGDVALLPYRDAGDPIDVLSAVATGQVVVTFPSCTVDDPAVVVVDHLDVDAAAGAVHAALAGDRPARAAAAEERFGVGPWVDALLAASGDRPR